MWLLGAMHVDVALVKMRDAYSLVNGIHTKHASKDGERELVFATYSGLHFPTCRNFWAKMYSLQSLLPFWERRTPRVTRDLYNRKSIVLFNMIVILFY